MSRPSLRRSALPLFGVAAGMLALAYAFVPLYTWFCQVTGFGGTPLVAEQGASEVLEQTITVRFDGSTAGGMPWEFAPVEPKMEIRIGETGLAFFRATNPTERRITGTAAYNVAPFSAGGYFVKIDCFCFTEQTLGPGESVEMPVTFYVDPEITRDRETRSLTQVTLAYTFYESEPAAPVEAGDAAAAPAGAAGAGAGTKRGST